MNKLRLCMASSPQSSRDVSFQRKRLLLVAVCSSTSRTQFLPTQRRVQECTKPAIWMETKQHSSTLSLIWCPAHSQPCHDLPHGTWGFQLSVMTKFVTSQPHFTDVCNNVATESPIQSLRWESKTARSANTDDGARVDVCARGFWNLSQDAFFDVRVFSSNTSSNCSTDLSSVYRRHEQVKKRECGLGIKEVGHDMFTPLALSTTGGMGREVTTFYKRLADMIA